MKNLARCAVVLTVVTTLGLTLALPALAGRRINYEGRTSQDERVRLGILKKADGRRFFSGGSSTSPPTARTPVVKCSASRSRG